LSTQLATPPPLERSRRFRSWTIIIVTNLISLVCLVWVLNGAGLQHIWGEIRHMHWAWVALSIGCDATLYLLGAWRWQLLLRPIARVRFVHAAQALYVGLFANEVRSPAGEVVRCFLISKSSDIPISVAFASALIERIFDGVWLMAGFFICLRIGHLPGVLLKGGYILGVMILILAAILGYAMYAKQQSLDLFFGMAWPRWLNTLIEDLHLIGHSRYQQDAVAPADGAAEIRNDPDAECGDVPDRREPAERGGEAAAQDKSAGEQGGGDAQGEETHSGNRGVQCKREKHPNSGVRDEESGVTGAFGDADGTRPAQLMQKNAAPGGVTE
jgi:hypothetical protein